MPSLTRADIQTLIAGILGDPDYQEFTETNVQDAIQVAQERFVKDTKCLKDVQTTTIVAGTYEYDLPTDILDVTRVSHNGLKLERVSEYDLDVWKDTNWAADTGTPRKYYIDLDPDNLVIRVYPIPVAADVSYSLIIEYIKIPPELTLTTSVPFNGNTLLSPYTMSIVYAAASDLMKQAPNQARMIQIPLMEKEYSRYVADCIDTFVAMEKMKPVTMAVGRSFGNL
jgi:hypothetical protein